MNDEFASPRGVLLPGVRERLATLRRLYVPERSEEVRKAMSRERSGAEESFDAAVGRRLRELRALCELAQYLHRASVPKKICAERL